MRDQLGASDCQDLVNWRWEDTHTGEEEIDVIANDLTIEERGRIERGRALGIVGGGWERISESENLSVEPWSEVTEI